MTLVPTPPKLKAALAFVPALAVVIALAGCSPQAEWTSWESESGVVAAEFPGEPELEQQQVPLGNGASAPLEASIVELGDDGYTISEIALPPNTPFDLDGAVQGSVESMLASVEQQLEATGTSELDTTETTEFNGNDARSYTGTFDVDDAQATFRGLTYLEGDTLVQVVAIDADSDNSDNVDRFFNSLAPGA